jgi:Periplasmic copper-binding protein (NosD).
MWFSSGNLIVANALTDCHVGSFAIGGCFNNQIYLNNIKNSNWYDRYYYDFYSDRWVRNGTPTITVSHNFWDNGSVGNYWSNYNGTDGNWDGVGSEPYVFKLSVEHFEGENTEVVGDSDNYPLMAPVDVNKVAFKLPEWVETAGAEQPQNTTPQQPTATPNAQAPSLTTVSPTGTAELPQTQADLSNQTLMVLAGTIIAVALAGALLVAYLKKRSSPADTFGYQ